MVTKITVAPTDNVIIGKVNEIIDEKQDNLVSGTNIKTVNNQSLLGSGNLTLSASDVGIEAYTANEVQAIWEAN